MPTWRHLPPAATRALTQEAHLAKSLVESGMTTLRNANHGRPGKYYEAFFELSIGMERIGKLIFALDHRVTFGSFPTDKQFRSLTRSARSYHDLEKLFKVLEEINTRREFNVTPYPGSTATGAAVLGFLSDFASRDRYYNLTTLSDHTEANSVIADPVAGWFKLVVPTISEKAMRLTPSEKAGLAFSQFIDREGLVLMRGESETGEELLSLESANMQALLGGRVQIHGSLLCIQLLRYLSEMVGSMDSVMNSAGIEAPYFQEFFYFWGNPDSYLRKRKTFSS